MIYGSLICNYIIYIISFLNTKYHFCQSENFKAIDFIRIYIFVLRFTGLYVFFYTYLEGQCFIILKTKLTNWICQRRRPSSGSLLCEEINDLNYTEPSKWQRNTQNFLIHPNFLLFTIRKFIFHIQKKNIFCSFIH